MRKFLFTLLFCLSKITFSLAEDVVFESFEENSPPSYWQSNSKGRLSVSKEHYKHGDQSLKWEFENNTNKLIVNDPQLTEAGIQKTGGIRFWVYNENAVKDTISFHFKNSKDEVLFTFKYSIDFKGWRGNWIRFRDDLGYKTSRGNIASMEIIAPTQEGTLFFDMMDFALDVPWNRMSDFQIQLPKNDGVWDTYSWYEKEPSPPTSSTISEDEKRAFETILERYNYWLFGSKKYNDNNAHQQRNDAFQSFIKRGIESFENYNIVRHEDGRITGVPLFSSRSPYKPKFNEDVAQRIFTPLALDYKINGNKESLEKVFLLFDYMYDQGWAVGSGIETLDHETNRSSGYMHAFMILKEELKATGRLNREMETIRWYTVFNQIFDEERFESTADDVRTNFIYRLFYILAMEDSPEKAHYMRYLVEWYNDCLSIQPGWAGIIKEDYTGYHHRGIYANAYAPNGFHLASLIQYMLHNTVFELSDTSIENLKQALLTQRIMANKFSTPQGINGRISNPHIIPNILPAYAMLALTGDNEMEGVFKRLWRPENPLISSTFNSTATGISFFNTLGAIDMMLDVADGTALEEEDPQGVFVKPYGGTVFFRKDNWMVSAKGFSQYIYDFEAGDDNVYGRYGGYGALQILATGEDEIDAEKSGFKLTEGWDWNRFPGTTVIRQSMSNLRFSGISSEHRSFSDRTFLGGTSLSNEFGSFGLDLADPTYEIGFEAKKSVFFFEDFFLCLGSNIKSPSSNKTETILFQNYLSSPSDQPIFDNSTEATSSMKYENSQTTSQNYWLRDAMGNGYIFPKGQEIEIRRQSQTSRDHQDTKDTFGDYAVAWLDHGNNTKNGQYEYAILVQKSAEELQNLSLTLPYEVLQQNEFAHIVHHTEKDVYGMHFFKPVATDFGHVRSVSHPLLVMSQQKKQELFISLTQPDFGRIKLNGTRDVSPENVFDEGHFFEFEIIINGKWKLSEEHESVSNLSHENGNTYISFNSKGGREIDLSLENPDVINAIELPNSTPFKVYPNPVNDILHLSYENLFIEEQFLNIELFNTMGQSVLNTTWDVHQFKTETININTLPKGIYFLNIGNGKASYALFKILVK